MSSCLQEISTGNKIHRIKKMVYGLVVVAGLLQWSSAIAQTTVQSVEESAVVNSRVDNQASGESKFTAYKPNFVILSYSEDDDTPLQVRFSARYKFLDCDGRTRNMASNFTCRYFKRPGKLRMYFSYTTDFDFYVASDGDGKKRRKSQPVRNRMTSPALHFDWQRKKPESESKFWWSNLTTSLVHHSNGQEIEYETFFQQSSTQSQIEDFIENLETSQPSWMDGVSRGWNYLELKGKFLMGNGVNDCDSRASCFAMYADLKLPITNINDDIWWEPGNDSKYTDYNGVEFTFTNEWKTSYKQGAKPGLVRNKELSLQLQCGLKSCSTKTWLRLDVYPWRGNFKLPLLIYGHFGKNEHFYNYHETNNTVGIGVQFRP